MKKIYQHIFLALLLASGLSACTFVDEGVPGPPGRDGNANVFSINYAVDESDWVDVGVEGEAGFFKAVDLGVPEITDDINETGLVLAYYRANSTEPWIALPFTRISHDPEYVESFDFIYDIGFVGLQSKATDLSANSYAGTVRIIIAEAIPLGKVAIDLTSYEQVAQALNLTEADQISRN